MPLPEPRPVREWHDVDRARFEAEIVPLGQPAILRGLVAHWPAAAAGASPEGIAAYLRRFDLERECNVLVGSPAAGGRFFYGDTLATMNFQERRPTLAGLVDRLLAAAHEPAPPTLAAQGLILPELLPGFAAENRLALLDESAVPRMWIGNRAIVAAHFDLMRNIACVVAGRRRFTVFPPEQLRNLYPGPYESTPAGTPVSMVDFDAPDLDRFPHFPEALEAAQVADLSPGDALYLPYMWWHHVRALSSFNILINYWWNPAPATGLAPFDALLHGLLALRDLPEEQRHAWRAMFDHFVFRANGDPMGHLPPAMQGRLGKIDPDYAEMLRAGLAQALAKAR